MKKMILLMFVWAAAAGIADAGNKSRDYLRRQKLADAQRRHEASRSQKNRPKPVPRKDLVLPPSERMELDRKAKAQEWRQRQFPNSQK